MRWARCWGSEGGGFGQDLVMWCVGCLIILSQNLTLLGDVFDPV